MISVEVLKSLFDLYEQLKDQNPKMANGIKNAIVFGAIDYFEMEDPKTVFPYKFEFPKLKENVVENNTHADCQPRLRKIAPLDDLDVPPPWDEYNDTPARWLTADEHDLAKDNKKIEAVKSIRARLNLGLKEAKDLYEVYYPILHTPF